MDNAKAYDLIKHLEQNQRDQIRYLQKLFSMLEQSKVEGNLKTLKEVRERLMERQTPCGSGGSSQRSRRSYLSDYTKTHISLADSYPFILPDLAAEFIAANALKDLAHYSFERQDPISNFHGDIRSMAFYIVDFNRHKETTLDTRNVSGPNLCSPERAQVIEQLAQQSCAFTIPYFRLSEKRPALATAPLTPTGIFDMDVRGGKYIREEKWSLGLLSGGTNRYYSLMVALSPLSPYRDPSFPSFAWIWNNFNSIKKEWETVLDALDQQCTFQLFSASSVAEGRLASEQSGNIRLLTMVTIAYLPLTLATAIYSMTVLPPSAGIVSYVVVTVIMCTITYVLVFYIRQIRDAISKLRNTLRNQTHRQRQSNINSKGPRTSSTEPLSTMA
ncbi:MAG: hypothetical protein Q9219_006481 [cf. Caloplaca sp. 3 TL-2023]